MHQFVQPKVQLDIHKQAQKKNPDSLFEFLSLISQAFD